MNQISFFDGQKPLMADKPIRLIELFAGIGAQAKALENLGIPFEHYRICEFDKYAVRSYNAVHDTEFETSDITTIHAEDVCVCDTDRYTYIMTYSFPCTDLSSAGKQAGMSRDSGTRSGLLWQVERLLKEMDELPQILLMENVPEVVSDKNMKDFAEWIAFLDSLGYRSKYEILNSKNYGVPQNRERCFMVSWLGDYYYDFPEPFPLEIRLKDVLEPVVDEKYYLSDEQVAKLKLSSDFIERERETCRAIRTGVHGSTDRHAWDIVLVDEPQRDRQSDGDSINSDGTGLQGLWQSDDDGRSRTWGGTDKIVVAGSLNPDKEVQDRVRVLSPDGICQGLRATDYKDPPKIIWADGIYLQCTEQFQRGPLNGLSRAIKATQHDAGVVCMETIESREIANLCKSGVKGYNEMNGRIYDTDGVCPTIRANSGGHNEIKIAIPQATKQGYIECELGGVIDMSYPNSKTRRGRVQEGGTVSPTIMANNNELYVLEPVIGAIRGRNPDNPSDRTPGIPTQQRLEIGGDVSNTLTTVQKDNVVVERMPFRVRKLTPLECWRLMGFSDVDFLAAKTGSVDVSKEILAKYPHEGKRRMTEAERLSKMSNSQLYKQAGNSIVVDVLMAIFKKML